MNSIQDIVSAKVQEMVESGEIQKKIEDSIQSSIESAIESQFRSYGGITKQIEKCFEDGLKFDTSAIDFEPYNMVMLSAVKSKVEKFFAEEASNKFMSSLDEIFSPAPKEMDVTDLVEKIVSLWKESNESYYDWEDYANVSLEAEAGALRESYSLKVWVKSDGYRSSTEKEIHLYINKNGEIRISHNMNYNPTCMFGDDAFIFRLYSAGTKITGLDDFDEDDCDLYVGLGEEY